jgi:hypothetical protein
MQAFSRVTVTVKLQLAVSPLEPVAVAITVVVPGGKAKGEVITLSPIL